MTLFEKISYLAKKRDKSLKEVAEELGLSRNAIYQWKTSSPKADTLQKVAEYFSVSTDYLLGRENNPESTEKENSTAVQLGGLFRSVAKKEDLNDQEQQELKEDLDWYIKERAQRIKERNKRG